MFTLTRLVCTDGTQKMRSHSESRGVHKGGASIQQKSLLRSGRCSDREVLLYVLHSENLCYLEGYQS